MSVAVFPQVSNPFESRRVYLCRACGRLVDTSEGTALFVSGGTVVSPPSVSLQCLPAGCDTVGPDGAGHDFWLIANELAVHCEQFENGSGRKLTCPLPESGAGFRLNGEGCSPHCVRALTNMRARGCSKVGFLDAAGSYRTPALRMNAASHRAHYRASRRLTLIGHRSAKESAAPPRDARHRRVRPWPLPAREDDISGTPPQGPARDAPRSHQRSCRSPAARASRAAGVGHAKGDGFCVPGDSSTWSATATTRSCDTRHRRIASAQGPTGDTFNEG